MRRWISWAMAWLLAVPALSFGGTISLSTNPAQFTYDDVDWCQLACAGDPIGSGTSWTSTVHGLTGAVLLENFEPFYNNQQGVSWAGNFAPDMGLVYNGSYYGSTPSDIRITFDAPVYGAGAWIQANSYGPFTATITAYGQNGTPLLWSAWAGGTSSDVPDTALFIGLLDTEAEIYELLFSATGIGEKGVEPDFAIGTVRIASGDGAVIPEPASFVLVGSGLAGAALVARWRRRRI